MAPYEHPAEAPTPSIAAPRDVRIALAYLRRALALRMTMPELAQLCGVPERTLHRHFVAFVGRPPLEHLRRMRLSAVRDALLAPDGGATVTRVATGFGFLHLGRFAAEYRQQFGEPPSATLSRARAAVADSGAAGNALGARPERMDDALFCPSPRRIAAELAVLHFRADTADPDLARFAESLTEQMTAGLRRFHGFAARLGGAGRSDRYCLTGHVARLADGTVRVVTQLRDRPDGECHVWGDAHHGTIDDLAGLLGRVVSDVVSAVQPGTDGTAIECARRGPPAVPRAGDLVLRALPLVLAADPTSATLALGMLEDAMGLDPDDARPVALAAWCRSQRVLYDGVADPAAERRRARQLADRAAALDHLADPWVLTARSGVTMAEGRRDEALVLLARAKAIDPGFGWAWERSAWVLANQGNGEGALGQFRRALPLKGPRAPIGNCLAGIGAAYFSAGRFAEAARWINRALTENPGAVWLNRNLAPCYLALGDRTAAAASVRRLREAHPRLTLAQITMARPPLCEEAERVAEGRILDGLIALGMPR
ncbi:helix-turn-helix domain-containing protein [Roseomonas terrae]|uniref:Helix-turn-helix domain-containing protein n=2 Tax=Neoroseomonas terrae TaxID=424799 RepID=A0ABS5EHG6_9PROT|nr:helix-turn-helix domain-containing protein [Neoroseomonas terrae]